MTRLLPLLLVTAIALTGCRESLTGPDPITPSPPSSPPPTATSDMYVKGPSEVAIGETATYRAELLEEASGYRWSFGGEGNATSGDGAGQREFTLTAITPGYIVVNFRAFGEDGQQIGYAEKLVILR
jgi:hypothetical protein